MFDASTQNGSEKRTNFEQEESVSTLSLTFLVIK